MIKRLSNNISEILVEGNIIKENDIDKCSYGIDIMFSSVAQIAAVFIISIFIRNFIETLLFFLMFIPLRIYAGGYHADSRARCFTILITVYIIFSLSVKMWNETLYMVIIGCSIAFTLTMVLISAPVLHSRKHLTKNEIHVFRKIAIIICCTETAIILLGMFFTGTNIYIWSCASGQLAVSLSMAAACIKKQLRRCKE